MALYILQMTSGSLTDPVVVKVQSKMLFHTAQEWSGGHHTPVNKVIITGV